MSACHRQEERESREYQGRYQATIATAYAIFNFLNRQKWRRLMTEDLVVMAVSRTFRLVVLSVEFGELSAVPLPLSMSPGFAAPLTAIATFVFPAPMLGFLVIQDSPAPTFELLGVFLLTLAAALSPPPF